MKMLKIFICDDEKKHQDSIKLIVNNYLFMTDLDAKIEIVTSDPGDLFCWENTDNDDLLFLLDLELNSDCNGIHLAANLREKFLFCKIAFITSHPEMVFLSFSHKIEAIDFISKDSYQVLKERITEVINTTITRIHVPSPHQKKFILVKSDNKDIKLYIEDILFFETSGTPHKVNAHLKNRQIEFYYHIKDIPKLNERFYRCHQSFVANISNIAAIDRRNRIVYFENEEKCFASIRYVKELCNRVKFENTLLIKN
ncbi:LytR/AlgR family response regulator transcription factor [Enterococcus durans]|nr:LytTR family DNA-binding domain-containing protein [Enterococcus durans]